MYDKFIYFYHFYFFLYYLFWKTEKLIKKLNLWLKKKNIYKLILKLFNIYYFYILNNIM